jgi:hypothetical protein
MAATITAKHGLAAGIIKRIFLQNKWRANLAELIGLYRLEINYPVVQPPLTQLQHVSPMVAALQEELYVMLVCYIEIGCTIKKMFS